VRPAQRGSTRIAGPASTVPAQTKPGFPSRQVALHPCQRRESEQQPSVTRAAARAFLSFEPNATPNLTSTKRMIRSLSTVLHGTFALCSLIGDRRCGTPAAAPGVAHNLSVADPNIPASRRVTAVVVLLQRDGVGVAQARVHVYQGLSGRLEV